ncbi:hypothetical protein PROP_03147 [Propionicimonas sp. T2.31MG-18]|uniref:hypothetical protein n=1 Tax=Propionicimonas sp. T2.31MG-18 TaxID=3157620 RepID=UPI0035E82E90
MIISDEAQVTFDLAGVVVVPVAGLNSDAVLECVAKVGNRALLLINADLTEQRLTEAADWVLGEVAARLAKGAAS